MRTMIDDDGAGRGRTGHGLSNQSRQSVRQHVRHGDAQDKNGDVFGASERITREEAIRLYTSSASRYSFAEAKTGTIEPGKYADMTVISDDILTVPDEAIKDIVAIRTIVEGKTVFEREPGK